MVLQQQQLNGVLASGQVQVPQQQWHVQGAQQ